MSADIDKTRSLYDRAKKIIPGGTQLLSKRPELFLPNQWPAYYSRAKGCRVWDMDGKEYIDMSYMGIGACILGYADEDVNNAVRCAVEAGSFCTLNAPQEMELAELLLELHPWAQCVRYARTGGEAMAQAVRIARAASGREKVLFCGYHGWHDWYLAANLGDDAALDGHLLPGLNPHGVPRALKGTAFPFSYNDTEAFQKLMSAHVGEIGAVVIEPIRNIQPKNGFLKMIRDASSKCSIPLIADEISAGWRLAAGGSHKVLNLEPDISVFAKGMSNGYPMAAIIGKQSVMDAYQKTFVSSTYWTDRIGPAAAIAAIKKMRRMNIPKALNEIGLQVKDIWQEASWAAGIPIKISGINPLGHFEFGGDNALALKSLFIKLMMDKGILATNAFYAAFSHDASAIAAYRYAALDAFIRIKAAMDNDTVENAIGGPVCMSGFARLT